MQFQFYGQREWGEESNEFEIQSDFKQKFALSLILFNLALEKVAKDMRETKEMEVNGKGVL